MVVAMVGVMIFSLIAIVKSFTRKTPGWIITAVFTGLLSLAIIGIGASMALSGVAGYLKEGGKIDRKLTSKDGRYSLTVPNSWKAMPELNKEASFGAGNIFINQYAMIITERQEDLNMDLPTFAKVRTEAIGKNMTGATLGEVQNLTVSGHPALRRSIQGTAKGLNLIYHHTSIDTGDALTQVMCWTIAGKEKIAFPVFEKVAATFTAKSAPQRPDLSKKSPTDRVRFLAAEQLGIEESQVTPASNLKTDLGADDLDHVALVTAIEEEFKIDVTDEVAKTWQRIEDIIRHVEKSPAAPAVKDR